MLLLLYNVPKDNWAKWKVGQSLSPLSSYLLTCIAVYKCANLSASPRENKKKETNKWAVEAFVMKTAQLKKPHAETRRVEPLRSQQFSQRQLGKVESGIVTVPHEEWRGVQICPEPPVRNSAAHLH